MCGGWQMSSHSKSRWVWFGVASLSPFVVVILVSFCDRSMVAVAGRLAALYSSGC